MASLDITRVLPERYYLAHFLAFTHDVCLLYGDWLSADELAYINQLRQLPEDALCLYLRLINRKPMYFSLFTMHYPDIANGAETADLLVQHGIISPAQPTETDADQLLAVWPVAYLQALVTLYLIDQRQLPTRLHTCKSKKKLLQVLSSHPNSVAMQTHGLTYFGPVWHIPHKPVWQWLLFLYFGYLETNLSQFAVHDLRTVKPDSPTALQPRFSSRQDAEQAYIWHQIYDRFRQCREDKTLTAIDLHNGLRDAINTYPTDASPMARQLKQRMTLKIAYRLEQAGTPMAVDHALTWYHHYPDVGDARIRQLKLLTKQGQHAHAVELAKQWLTEPVELKETLYIKRFIARAEKHPADRDIPTLLRHIPVVDTTWSIEKNVLHYFNTQGWHGIHSENWVWQCLFGLTFWQDIYDYGVFHHRLQITSQDVHDVTRFWQTRREAFEHRLRHITTSAQWVVSIDAIIAQHYGKPNGFVVWSDAALDTLKLWLQKLPLASLKAVLQLMAQDIRYLKTGLPDLFVWNDTDYAFYEVKSANDRLSHIQTFRIRQFQQLQLPVWVFKVAS
jgi:hypothetical protein